MLEKAKDRMVVVVRGRGNEARKRRHSAHAALPGLEKATNDRTLLAHPHRCTE
jgi:hypothetical protein